MGSHASPIFVLLIHVFLLHLVLMPPSAVGLINCWQGRVIAREEPQLTNYSVRADVASTEHRPPPVLRVVRCPRNPGLRLIRFCAACLRVDTTETDGPLPHHEILLACLADTMDCPVCVPKQPRTRCSYTNVDGRGRRVNTMCCNFNHCSMTPGFDEKVACSTAPVVLNAAVVALLAAAAVVVLCLV